RVRQAGVGRLFPWTVAVPVGADADLGDLYLPNWLCRSDREAHRQLQTGKELSMEPLVKTTGLTLAFGGVVAADNIDFELHEGERLAVIGQNGAGKTTFINICTGYLAPSKGKVYFDGRDVTAMAPRKIVRLGLGRSFQLPQLFTEHTVRQCVQIAAARRNKELSWFRSLESTIDEKEVDATLDLVGLLPEADEASIELPEGKR